MESLEIIGYDNTLYLKNGPNNSDSLPLLLNCPERETNEITQIIKPIFKYLFQNIFPPIVFCKTLISTKPNPITIDNNFHYIFA